MDEIEACDDGSIIEKLTPYRLLKSEWINSRRGMRLADYVHSEVGL